MMAASVTFLSLAVLTLTLLSMSFADETLTVKERDPCLRPCPRIMRPVCASNGQTYSSECVMQVAACRAGLEIVKVSEGRCGEVVVEQQQSLVEEEAPQEVEEEEVEVEEALVEEEPNCNRMCTFIYLPVCGSDGRTYPNECVFETANCRAGGLLSIDHEGPCGQQPEVRHLINERDTSSVNRDDVRDECMRGCPRHYRPVCASDGQTYANDCVFQIANCRAGDQLTVVSNGRCPVANQAPANELVDDEDEDEDDSDEDDADDIDDGEADADAEEAERDECERPCPRMFRQVCASNGETYNNHCLFLIANCRAGGTLAVVSQGACSATSRQSDVTTETSAVSPSIEDCMRGCTREYNPVCASDGTSHSNPCVFEIANCMAGGTLTVVRSGRCNEERPARRNNLPNNQEGRARPKESSSRPRCSRRCPLNLDPVCASNGKTYGNQCRFDYAKCKRRGELSVVHQGACEREERRRRPSRGRPCRRPCPLLLAPVCGSNGRTYANTCLFNNANCRAGESLTIAREGRC